jgi:uncharacterized protein DUF4129
VRVIGRVARVVVAAAVLLGVALPAAADEPASPFPAERIAGDQDAQATRAAQAARAARIDQARGQVLDDAYQAELPGYGAGSAGSGSGSGGMGARPRRLAGGELADERERRAMFDAREHQEGGAMSSLMTMLMWGMVIVIGVLLAFWFASEISKFGGDAELPPVDESRARMQAAADAIIDRPLGDADELARRGEFAEAIHTLLLRTLQELVRSAAVRVAPATTSREILARVPLLADARSALAGLITAVEITHFGDEPANAGDYDRCRQQFHVFAQAFRMSGLVQPQAAAA